MDFHPDRRSISAEVPWNFIIITCMSFDLDSGYFEKLLKHLHPEIRGMNAWVIRNAGGRVTDDVIRSVIIATRLLGSLHCFVIHHTCCGLYRMLNNSQIRDQLALDLGPCSIITRTCQDSGHRDKLGLAQTIDFMPFTDLHASVIEDMATLHRQPLISPSLRIHGYIYDDDDYHLYSINDPIIARLRCSPGTQR
jgi:carbonic anhydrase